MSQVVKNEEIKSLISILGLDFRKSYADGDVEGLRYNKVMIMADQDMDGSHIKGLIINFFRYYWPELLKRDGFITQFMTPLLKANRRDGKEIREFFSVADYHAWRNANADTLSKFHIKYYKGLGTSTSAEAKAYFREMDKHHRQFYWEGDNDGEHLDMVFEKDRAEERREWILSNYSSDVSIDLTNDKGISYSDFVNKGFTF